MIRLLVVVLLAAYAISATLSGAWWDIPATELLNQGASFAPAVAGGESWRLLSAAFLHGGLPHLLFNLLALWEIGRPLERQLGRAPTLAIFLLSASAGFLLSLHWQPDSISVGASGGIFGLLGAWAVEAWRGKWRDSPAGRGEGVIWRKWSIFVVLLFALGSGFLIPNVDHAAHLGGLIVGLLLGALASTTKRRSLIFFASCAVLAGGLFAATRQLPIAWQIDYEETRDYAAFYRRFAEEDRAISAALQAIGEASRNDQLTEAEGLARLDADLLPRLTLVARQLRQPVWQTDRIARDAARWAEYAEHRLAAVSAMRHAIASPDPVVAHEELARFERLMSAAARLAQNAPTTSLTPRRPDDR